MATDDPSEALHSGVQWSRRFPRPACVAVTVSLLASLPFGPTKAQTQKLSKTPQAELLEPGRYSGWSGPESRRDWLGLYCRLDKRKTSRLKRCAVTVGPETEETEAGNGFGPSRAITVSPETANVVFAVRCLPHLRSGSVVTCFYSQDPVDLSATPFRLGEKRYRLTQREVSSQGARQDEIDLQCGSRKQNVAQVSSKMEIDVVWAGDLDGDGKLDLYVRRQFNNYHVSYTLYLSSYARRGKLVGAAADGGGRMIGAGG